MPTVLLVRHGRTSANATGVLAGRQGGVRLDPRGQEQVRAAAERLRGVPLALVASSPLLRCRETAAALVAGQAERRPAAPELETVLEKRLTECDYGTWQGRALKDLAKEKLWATVQQHPSAVQFPDGESMRAMQARAVDAIRDLDERVAAESGRGAVWAAVSHGDVIKSILAEALGMHLDHFQRIAIDPGSVSVVRFTPSRPHVLATNTTAGDLAWTAPTPPRGSGRRKRNADDAVVGGGAGPESE